MARKRYPSDDKRRKQRPHVKVHLSIRSHPRYAEVFEDPELRGIWLGLLLLGVQYHAAKTDNIVSLGLSDLVWCTGRAQRVHAECALNGLCVRMGWTVRQVGKRWEVHLRNLEDKQGFGSATPPVAPRPPSPSEEQKNRGTEEQTPGAESAPRTPAKPGPASWSLSLSELLIEKVKTVPGGRIPRGARSRWAGEIELLVVETDSLRVRGGSGIYINTLRRGIEWAFSPANLGVEFEVVIRSGSSLRRKWGKLVDAKQRADRKANGTGKPLSEMVVGTREYCIRAGTPYNPDDDPTQPRRVAT